jgi:hypothetical protein
MKHKPHDPLMTMRITNGVGTKQTAGSQALQRFEAAALQSPWFRRWQ